MNYFNQGFLVNRNFTLIWIGQVASQVGSRMFQIALLWWLVHEYADDAGIVSAILMTLAFLPSLVLANWIGRTIDLRGSKTILIGSDAFASLLYLVVGVLIASGHYPLWITYSAVLLGAFFQALIDPSLNKAVEEMVEPDRRQQAVGIQGFTVSIGNFAGAAFGALMIANFELQTIAFFNAVSYLAALTCTALTKPLTDQRQMQSPTKQLGWGILSRYTKAASLLYGYSAIHFFAVPTLIVLPVYIKRLLNQDATMLAIVESSLWVGIFAGTVFAGRLTNKSNVFVVGAIASFIIGVCLVLPGVFVSQIGLMVGLFGQGVAASYLFVRSFAMFHQTVAPEQKGQFFAIVSAVLNLTFPLGFVVTGLLIDYISIPTICYLQGGGVLLIGVYYIYAKGLELKRERALGRYAA